MKLLSVAFLALSVLIVYYFTPIAWGNLNNAQNYMAGKIWYSILGFTLVPFSFSCVVFYFSFFDKK